MTRKGSASNAIPAAMNAMDPAQKSVSAVPFLSFSTRSLPVVCVQTHHTSLYQQRELTLAAPAP